MAVPSFAMADEDQQARLLQVDIETRALHRTVDWLRPFVETMGWEYVVVWKLGDDPSRFIEWIGCCCSGFKSKNVKEEKTEPYDPSPPLCRDGHCKHYVRTRACQALSQFPSLIPLYSGIHGEVVISNEHRWISSTPTSSNSNSSPESMGIQVLIPVAGGIIELFNKKNVPEDLHIVELVTNRCQFFSDQESTMTSLSGQLFLENYTRNSSVQIFTPSLACGSQSTNTQYSSYEGSSSNSDPSNRNTPVESFVCRDSQSLLSRMDFSGRSHKENDCKIGRGSRESGNSKNLLAERRRRNKIKERLFALRAIVPKISKMDRVAILTDAMDYIEELKGEIKSLRDELEKFEEEECRFKNREPTNPKLNVENKFNNKSPVTEDLGEYSCLGIPYKKEVQVEVKQIGNKAILVRLLCDKSKGWFSRLMEVLCSLGLDVLDANVTTMNAKALVVLRLEGRKEIYPKIVKDSLIKVATS